MVLIRCDEEEEVLADRVVNRMLLEHEQIRFTLVCLMSHHPAELAKVLSIFLA